MRAQSGCSTATSLEEIEPSRRKSSPRRKIIAGTAGAAAAAGLAAWLVRRARSRR